MEDAQSPDGANATAEVTEQQLDNTEQVAPESSNESPRYTVKVDGQDVEVTLEEALAGYQRQSHFTRAQQELAAERESNAQAVALFNALQEDPEGTISALADRLNELQYAQDNDEEVDPVQAELEQMRAFMNEQQQAARVQAVNTQIEDLQTRMGTFDRDALLDHAIEWEIPNLEVALIHMRATSSDQQRQQQEQQVQQQKQQLPPVADGSSKAAGSSTRGRQGPPSSVKEALEEALSEANLTTLPPIDFDFS